MSRNAAPTDTELQRIDRGELIYSDDSWYLCDTCNGQGETRDGHLCPQCGGDGELPKGGTYHDEEINTGSDRRSTGPYDNE